MHLLFLQLLHEFNNLEGKDNMLETMKANWKRVCESLKSDSSMSSYTEEKEVIQKIENVYHRKSASPININEVTLNNAHQVASIF